tara:strand:+ start:5552 stop:6034 length:483 start_codon:yes stop_codon:yes gene_type:complete
MDKNKGPNLTPKEFFNYVSAPITDDFRDMSFKVHNIIPEKTELYHEILISLFDILFDTYLGEEIINTENKSREHFEWCWNKNKDNFKKEKIFFNEEEEILDYFTQFALESFYNEDFNKIGEIETKIRWFWNKCFDYSSTRTRSELDILVEVYKLFEKSLK